MERELADRLYVFCPDAEEGIEFVIQELPEAVVKMSNALKNGQFLTSRYRPVKWDPSINGDIQDKERVGYTHSELARVYEGEYGAKTIIVDKATFVSLLSQLKSPKTHSYNGYKLFELPVLNKKDTNDSQIKNEYTKKFKNVTNKL